MNLLHISSSIFEDQGKSSQMGQYFEELWRQRFPNAELTKRDLAKEPVPHLTQTTFQSALTPVGDRNPQQQNAAQLADQLIEELQAADVLLLGVPMYNFGIPSTLKAWIDHIARAGTTFKYTENGPVGLLKNKTAVVMAARGGVYKDTPNDTQTPYLKTLLGFVGIEKVHFIYAEKLSMGDDGGASVMAEAKQQIEKLIAQIER